MNAAQEPALRPLNVMIVDDHHGFRELIREMLGGCAAILQFGRPSFTECGSGEEALQCASRQPPDLVTVDVHMGGMDGLECIRRLRPVLPRSVMIVVTATRDGVLAERSLLAGADAVICKDDLASIPAALGDHVALAGGA